MAELAACMAELAACMAELAACMAELTKRNKKMKFLITEALEDHGAFKAMEENEIYDNYGKHVDGHPEFMVKGFTVYRYERKELGYVKHHVFHNKYDASSELAWYATLDDDNLEVYYSPKQAMQMISDCYEGEEAERYLESLKAAMAELGD